MLHNKRVEKNMNLENTKSYKDKGIFLAKNFFNLNEIRKIKQSINQVKKNKPQKFKGIMKYYEKNLLKNKKQILVRAEYFYDLNNKLRKLIDSKKIKNVLKKLTGGKCIIFKEKINFKPPGCRQDKLHQDMQGDWEKYSKNFISVLVSIDKSSKENGCLEFDISGNNHKKLKGPIFKELKISKLKKPKFKKIELDSGDVVFFNAYIPHRSGKNLSKLNRSQIYLTYNKKKDGNFRKIYFAEKRVNYPPNNERELNKSYSYKI